MTANVELLRARELQNSNLALDKGLCPKYTWGEKGEAKGECAVVFSCSCWKRTSCVVRGMWVYICMTLLHSHCTDNPCSWWEKRLLLLGQRSWGKSPNCTCVSANNKKAGFMACVRIWGWLLVACTNLNCFLGEGEGWTNLHLPTCWSVCKSHHSFVAHHRGELWILWRSYRSLGALSHLLQPLFPGCEDMLQSPIWN